MSVPPIEAATAYVEGTTQTGVHWRMGVWRPTVEAEAAQATVSSAADAGRPDVRRRRLLARRWARELVTARLGVEWTGFSPDIAGRKPRLRGPSGVDVSIAHGDATLLVAVVTGGQLGADVEDEPFAAFDRASLVRRMCGPAERAALDAIPPTLRRRALARAWTIKEATLKARGVGLAVDPRSVEVDVAGLAVRQAATGPEYAIVHLVDAGRTSATGQAFI